jgi:hypothetical protein
MVRNFKNPLLNIMILLCCKKKALSPTLHVVLGLYHKIEKNGSVSIFSQKWENSILLGRFESATLCN